MSGPDEAAYGGGALAHSGGERSESLDAPWNVYNPWAL